MVAKKTKSKGKKRISEKIKSKRFETTIQFKIIYE